jgi:hypothetical protein
MAVKLLRDDDNITIKDADLVEGGDKDTSYTLRHLTPEKIDEIRERHTRKANYRRPAKTNEKLVDQDLLDYVLIAWTGIVDGDKPAPCEIEYKLRLDKIRRSELLRTAGMAEVVDDEEDTETRAASFREPADVR